MAENADTSTGTENQESTQDGGNANADAKFTQADMDKAIATRLAREQSKWTKQLKAEVSKASEESIASWREENGLNDDVLAKLQTSDDAKVELTKTKGKLTKAENAKLALEEKYNSVSSRLREALVRDQILREAAGKFNDPNDAVLHLGPELRILEDDWTVYHVDANGEPSGKEIPELLTGLLEARPYLAPATASRGAGSRVGEPGKGGNAEPKPGERGYLAHRLGGGSG